MIFLVYCITSLFYYVFVLSPAPTWHFPTLMARYSLFVLKVPLNPKQTNNHLTVSVNILSYVTFTPVSFVLLLIVSIDLSYSLLISLSWLLCNLSLFHGHRGLPHWENTCNCWNVILYWQIPRCLTSRDAPCGLQGCKNRPAPFPGRMSFKATKPGSVCLVS